MQKVFQSESGAFEISLVNFKIQSGVYFGKIESAGYSSTIKLHLVN
jgi:hypothetical protein